MNNRQRLAQGLADAFLCGDPNLTDLIARGATALGRPSPWLNELASQVQA